MTEWHITSGFHEHDSAHADHLHQGIDFGIPLNTPIRAFEGGTVTQVTHEGTHGFGDAVWIKFNDGYTAVLGHLNEVYVQPGDRVYIQEVIARSGGVGPRAGHSTGEHLHLGILDTHGKWVDPEHYINLHQVMEPSVTYGSGDWAHSLVSKWFGEMGNALGDGMKGLFQLLIHELSENMPVIVAGTLVIGGFLKMFGSKVWAPRMFVSSCIGAAWMILAR